MGAIWNNVARTHDIRIQGKSVGKLNVLSQIVLSPSTGNTLETQLNSLYVLSVKSKGTRKVTFHIFDKATGEYSLCIHDASFALPDKWWESK